MTILGYTPYHMLEVLTKHGYSHMKIVREAVIAANDRFSGIPRYQRPELDKWLAEYDCLIEIPSYIGMRAMESYAKDPDIKFILTERDPDKWVRSFNNTAGEVGKAANVFPMNILKRFDAELGGFFENTQLMYWAMSDGTDKGHPDNEAALRKNYIEYIHAVKETLPQDRTLVIKLEDGLGWAQICPFLEMDIPDQPYPQANVQEKFQAIIGDFMRPRVMAAMVRLGVVVAPTLGVAGYLGWKYGLTVIE
ncbi:hypothetical protein FE257_010023 [Aspergillus nanangensis]|uniref:Uncharacterized protein n=1 Tax=Aspergillus nanangensis TaxID=2582783 RepID=A0AAD4CY03_ASPNN|nr:hypothetical protein FE257_010023 [Aspergillus nanangensis]